MLNSLVMHHIPNDQVYTIIMLCQILGNQVYAIREVDIWRRALSRDRENASEGRTSERQGRQSADFGGGRGLPALGLLQEGCQTTGYETQIRQDCETIVEEVCSNVTVAKFNKKIEKTCTTKVSWTKHSDWSKHVKLSF